jgi:hypothetical protein
MSTRKLYIESRLCEGTGSDFVYNLRQSVECPQGTAALIDEVLCPNTFLTVDANRRFLYLKETDESSGTSEARVRAELPEGKYDGHTLAPAVVAALNHVKTASPNYTCTYSEVTGRLSIHNSSPGSFTLMTTDELLALGVWGSHHFGPDPQDANDVVGVASNKTFTTGTLYLQNMIRTMPFQNFFLCSSDFGTMNQSQGPSGETNILRRIPVNQPWGSLLHSQHSGTASDYVDVSGQLLTSISFSLRDVKNRVVDLKGHGISFSMCPVAKEIV